MEHKFENIQIAFNFLSILVLRDHSMESKQKGTWGGIMLIGTFILKVINNGRKILTHYEIDDRIAEQTELVITQTCKESKLWIHPNLLRLSFSFTYRFNFTYFCIVYIQTLKNEFC